MSTLVSLVTFAVHGYVQYVFRAHHWAEFSQRAKSHLLAGPPARINVAILGSSLTGYGIGEGESVAGVRLTKVWHALATANYFCQPDGVIAHLKAHPPEMLIIEDEILRTGVAQQDNFSVYGPWFVSVVLQHRIPVGWEGNLPAAHSVQKLAQVPPSNPMENLHRPDADILQAELAQLQAKGVKVAILHFPPEIPENSFQPFPYWFYPDSLPADAYYDDRHLNHKGMNIFSLWLSHRIEAYCR